MSDRNFPTPAPVPDGEDIDLGRILEQFRSGGDQDACNQLWTVLYPRVVAAARRRISSQQRRVSDEEDIAQSAMRSLLRMVDAGQMNGVQDGNELWSMLFTIMVRKIARSRRRLTAEKRGGGRVRGHSVLEQLIRNPGSESGDSNVAAGFDVLMDPRSIDQVTGELMAEYHERLQTLPNDTLRAIAVYRMEGMTVDEIAAVLRISRASVRRKMSWIRILWRDKDPHN